MKVLEFNGVPTYDPNDSRWMTITEELCGKKVDVIYRKGQGGLNQEELMASLENGNEAAIFSYTAPVDTRVYDATENIECHRDVPVKLRDGVTIYADIYMPKNRTERIPLIVSWGPFGKNAAEGTKDWKLMGVPPKTVSPMAKFESADPGYWCRYGYAVANVDPRGIGNSEGYVSNWGPQDGKDGYDFIEWAAVQDWCNGKVSLFGNSGVCMVIWRIAQEQPPHLACIGAWEGTGDMYRESFAMGGIPGPAYNELMISGLACKTYVEDSPNMLATHPLIDEYWEDRMPRWRQIKVPAYICGGLCHIHLRGSTEAFRRIRSPKKWLRLHREMEWPDTYNPDNLEDLRRFYDRYLKDINNGWEFTPKVRIDVMDAYDYDFQPKRPEREFPLKRTEYRKVYLDAKTHSASYEPYAQHSEAAYNPETETTTFDMKFQEDTEITGYMKLHTFVECRGHNNMDLFLWVKKLGQNGEYIPVSCMNEPYRGAWGYFRCSHRELDERFTTDFQPVQAHRKNEPMEEGKIYEVDIEFYPTSRIWHKGESLRLEIQGRFIPTEWYEDGHFCFTTDNGKGTHVIHTGGEYASYLQIPVIPPKYQSGDYVYR